MKFILIIIYLSLPLSLFSIDLPPIEIKSRIVRLVDINSSPNNNDMYAQFEIEIIITNLSKLPFTFHNNISQWNTMFTFGDLGYSYFMEPDFTSKLAFGDCKLKQGEAIKFTSDKFYIRRDFYLKNNKIRFGFIRRPAGKWLGMITSRDIFKFLKENNVLADSNIKSISFKQAKLYFSTLNIK
jgi:hypothetical protein